MTVAALSGLSGLIPDEEGAALAALAGLVSSEHAIVELGSYKGKSTCYLAQGARDGNGATVYAIDAWDSPGNASGRHGYAEQSTKVAFAEQVESAGFRLGTDVVPIKGFSVDVAKIWRTSHEVAGPPVGMLYIDADHAYESVWGDFWSWWPHLTDDACVAFDDYRTPRNPGVEQVVHRIERGGHFSSLDIMVERLAVAWIRKP